ncbi:MAG: hypothetical protein HXY43_11795 [Fischerella sp.]|jgi:hypothetical protein|uniref:hypothetical protein n=1 Tax=unclassified Fischerella TaxID=494603 RepID=UPI00047EB881|nr:MULTISPECIES: hypothetical protein [unclassified Fischerella]NWF59934.1 hypothetical protein [Fischerella sp.]
MNFSFGRQTAKANPEKIRQVKEWIYQALQIDEKTSVSLSQLQCTEPGCAPIETVIVVMTNPAQQYKVHKSIAEIEYQDINQLVHS